MMHLRKIFLLLAILFVGSITDAVAQKPVTPPGTPSSQRENKKPYKILTAGKKITIQSLTPVKNLLVWSARGHRVVERKNLNSKDVSFQLEVPENIFFFLIEMENGDRFTEKIGVR